MKTRASRTTRTTRTTARLRVVRTPSHNPAGSAQQTKPGARIGSETGADPGLNQSRQYLPVDPFMRERLEKYRFASRPNEGLRELVNEIVEGYLTAHGG